MIALVEWLILISKGRRVHLDRNISIMYLLRLVGGRLLSLFRGLLKTGRPVFIGRGVSLRSPGKLAVGKGVEILRYSEIDCLSKSGLKIGSGSKIGAFSIVKVSGSLSDIGEEVCIGSNVSIGDYAHIGGAAKVVIGDDTITGAYLSIHPENHVYERCDIPIRLQGVTRKGISIGGGCWIGAKVTFIDGSVIGAGSVVAAGSVVTGQFPDRVLIGGVPARVIKKLDNDECEKEPESVAR